MSATGAPVSTDTIELRGLRLVGICGALPEGLEDGVALLLAHHLRGHRRELPPGQVDGEGRLEARGEADELAATVDYGAICAEVERVVSAGRPRLLEFLAQALADAVMALDPRVDSVTVAVRKLRPPVPQPLATSGVRIHRSREDQAVE